MRLPTGRFHPRAIAGTKAKVGDALVWKGTEYGPGSVGGEVRFLYLTVHPDNATLSLATHSVAVPLSTALTRGYQDASGTFMFATTGSVSIGWEAVGGAVSGPSFTDLGFVVHRMADSNGTLLAPTVRESMTSGEFISYDAGTGLATGTGHSGTLFHVNANDAQLFIDVAGLYHVYAFLTWV